MLRGLTQEDLVSAFLYRLGRTSARHPFRVLGIWVVAAIAIVALQGAAGGQWDNSERVPGVESQHAADVLNDRFPSQGGLSARIVLHTDEGRLDDPAKAATVEQARARAQLEAYEASLLPARQAAWESSVDPRTLPRQAGPTGKSSSILRSRLRGIMSALER